VEAYLRALGQGWREDSSNRHLTFTRNRIRHELLPLLEGWNPRLREHLAQMAELARDEEAWWQGRDGPAGAAVAVAGPPGAGRGTRRPARAWRYGCDRLAALAPAVQRRLLRYAAEQLGAALDFPSTEALRTLALTGRAGQKLELAKGCGPSERPGSCGWRVGSAAGIVEGGKMRSRVQRDDSGGDCGSGLWPAAADRSFSCDPGGAAG
jgi:tRNA(Ile)-lysidine synthase